ncbi:MAG: dTDP-4-dehydrorhamnose 3,5-epimerase [Mucinivorans sp.]
MNKFKVTETSIEGLVIVEPTVFGDARGFFMETYAERDFVDLGIDARFVQDNHSSSSRGVLRGLHFQSSHTQGKLIRVVRGAVLDVALDLRPESPTFGHYESVLLTAENKRQFFVPKRFAHGFLTIEDGTEFLYKCTDYYCAAGDGGVRWDDSAIGIDWQFERWGIDPSTLNLSPKDLAQPLMGELDWTKVWQ